MPESRKPLFDTVRSVLKRGFRQSEVDAIDTAIDRVFERKGESASGVPHIKPSRPISADTPRTIGPDGIAIIKQFEGCARLRRDGLVAAYPDPGTGGAPWTIGWGATRGGLHGFVGQDTVWTQAQCDERLEEDLKRYAADVARAIGSTPTTQPQFDAMVSFHYNTGAIARATLTKKHVAGDYEGAAAEFARWNKAGGRVLKGLIRRRSAEMALYRRQ
ncbi:lysozyme [Erythrobacter sp. F6033]|uniref:lysozyme n=1 Tax=Erythrobacter sp. F6033 TaxID=2926401 RepID=UPI001FF669A9|nr:lysozyme [Erythrobacter sp. F6033]MCK0129053.1 lysozyme [Erythrobacter sp. F6033]